MRDLADLQVIQQAVQILPDRRRQVGHDRADHHLAPRCEGRELRAGFPQSGLQGRIQEAETIARGDLSPAEAQANVAYLRQMLAQQQQWKKDQRGSPLTPSTGS